MRIRRIQQEPTAQAPESPPDQATEPIHYPPSDFMDGMLRDESQPLPEPASSQHGIRISDVVGGALLGVTGSSAVFVGYGVAKAVVEIQQAKIPIGAIYETLVAGGVANHARFEKRRRLEEKEAREKGKGVTDPWYRLPRP